MQHQAPDDPESHPLGTPDDAEAPPPADAELTDFEADLGAVDAALAAIDQGDLDAAEATASVLEADTPGDAESNPLVDEVTAPPEPD